MTKKRATAPAAHAHPFPVSGGFLTHVGQGQWEILDARDPRVSVYADVYATLTAKGQRAHQWRAKFWMEMSKQGGR